MKNRLITLLLLFIGFTLNGQLFRSIQPVEPLTIAEASGGKFATLVKKRTANSTKYYFVNSDSTGVIPTIAFRYGNIFTDSANVVYPVNYVAYFNCGIYDGLVVGSWDLVNKPTKIRRFNDAWWVIQEVNGTPSVDAFQPRGSNFLSRGDHTVTYPTILDSRCLSKLASGTTNFDGLEFPSNFTTPSGYVFDADADIYLKEGSTIPPDDTTQVIANNTPYVFPTGGSEGYFNPSTGQYEANTKLMQLQLTENNGTYTLKDLSTYFNRNIAGSDNFTAKAYKVGQLVEHNGQVYICKAWAGGNNTPEPPNATYWDAKTLVKRYFISFNQTSTEGYSAAQMQAGINVDGWQGKEIRVFMGYFPDTGELSYLTGTSQQVYIPGVQSTETISGGTYYNRHPQQVISTTDRVPRWNEYITSDFNVPAENFVVIDAKNQAEITSKTTYGSKGVYSRVSETAGKKYLFVGDDWLTDIGHPCAYNCTGWQAWWDGYKAVRGGLSGATTAIKAQFKQRVTDRANNEGYSYIMLNNELWSQWNSEFENVIKQCYDAHNATSTAVLSAWTDKLVTTEFDLDKTRAYQDYIDTRTYDQFAADNTRFFSLTPTSSHKYSLDVNQIGFYFTDRNPNNQAKTIAQALMSKKYNLPQKVIPTIWNVTETLIQPLFYYQEIYQDRPILSRTKDFVSPHLLRNYAAISCFFGDGVHMWHNGYTIGNIGEHYFETSVYVNGEGRLQYMDAQGGYKVVSPLSPNNAVPWSKETTIDWLINGVWAVYKNPQFNTVKAEVAEVSLDNGNTWRTGADAFVIGAAVDKAPFAAFKQIGNEYLVFAIDFNGTTGQFIKVRMNGVVKDVYLRADNVSIVKF